MKKAKTPNVWVLNVLHVMKKNGKHRKRRQNRCTPTDVGNAQFPVALARGTMESRLLVKDTILAEGSMLHGTMRLEEEQCKRCAAPKRAREREEMMEYTRGQLGLYPVFYVSLDIYIYIYRYRERECKLCIPCTFALQS